MHALLHEIEQYWTRRAGSYSEVVQYEMTHENEANWMRVIEENLPKNRDVKILDIGTGPGFFAIGLAKRGYDVTAVDYTQAMLDEAVRNAGPYRDRIRFLRMDAHKLDFADNTFDAIVTRNLTWNLERPQDAYNDWCRVLKPGGILLNFDAGWYTYLFDEKKEAAFQADRAHVAELGILDLDNTADFDNAPVGTGPFVITSFEPEGTVQVARNDNYWGGDVTLDGAVFYYMQDDDTKLMAMQNGEVDCCTGVSAAAMAVFEREPDTYRIVSVPATRLQFYILNENRLDDAVRAAVNLTVDRDAIAAYLNGTVTAANGPFGAATAYGKVTVPAVDTDRAKALLEADGYTLNADGVYEKDGRELSLNIAYYAARSLDTLATLIQEQLKNVGIAATLTVAEDPDSTYIATADFDLALYCMIADKSGDPYYFIDSTLRNGAYFNVGGFESGECEALIDQLRYETDTSRRAALANGIVQLAIDDNAFGYVGLFNKTTVLRPGVSGFAETCPFDFYGIDAHTDKT